ncbi:GNAT family N-acetyltransferase [Actinomycetes bacterium KLBMP 9797]
MRIEVTRPRELGTAEVERWRQIQSANPALRNPFLAPEFSLAVDQARDTARVAVVEDGGRVVGFFPFERQGRFLGTAIGFGIADCTAFIHEPGLEWDAPALIRACGLPVWEFDHLIADQTPFAPHHALRVPSAIMDVSEGYDAYLSERTRANGGLMKDLQRRIRKLGREIGEVRFEYEVHDPEPLRTLMAWKSAQYQRTRVHDRFATPWIRQVVEHLAAAKTAQCTGTMSVLYAGDRPVALHFGLRSETVFSGWFPAYDPDLGKYSVGRALWLRLAEHAAAGGAGYVDLGRGEASYKDELKSRDLTIAEGRVSISRPVAAVRETRAAFWDGVHRIRRRRPLRHVRRAAAFVKRNVRRAP